MQPTQCTAQCQTEPAVNLKEMAVQTDGSLIGGLHNGRTVSAQTDMVQNQFVPLRFEQIAENDDLVRVYTGMPNSATFQMVFEELPSLGACSAHAGRHSLRPIDQYLMTLMRLKLGLVLGDLSFRFSVSKATCSKIVDRWVEHLYVQLSFLTYWPTREQINHIMPSDFKEMFPRTRVVIGCTELYTETPGSLADQSPMSSQCKTHKTWKSLVGITPNGVVSFVSDLWAGSISDKQVVQKSKLLDLCERGDAIMADEGFLISDLTTPLGIELIIPPTKDKNKQMSKEDTILGRRVENCRIHVERHMERVKKFRILHHLTGMKASVNKIWKVCNNLTALLPPLHPHDADDEDDTSLNGE